MAFVANSATVAEVVDGSEDKLSVLKTLAGPGRCQVLLLK